MFWRRYVQSVSTITLASTPQLGTDLYAFCPGGLPSLEAQELRTGGTALPLNKEIRSLTSEQLKHGPGGGGVGSC